MSNSYSSRSSDERSAAARGYGHAWRKARVGFLASHPLCLMCEQLGRITAASVVDHIKPHKGDQALFWDRSNWQPLCKPCHDGAKQRLEQGRGLIGSTVDGMPVDPGHHWN